MSGRAGHSGVRGWEVGKWKWSERRCGWKEVGKNWNTVDVIGEGRGRELGGVGELLYLPTPPLYIVGTWTVEASIP